MAREREAAAAARAFYLMQVTACTKPTAILIVSSSLGFKTTRNALDAGEKSKHSLMWSIVSVPGHPGPESNLQRYTKMLGFESRRPSVHEQRSMVGVICMRGNALVATTLWRQSSLRL